LQADKSRDVGASVWSSFFLSIPTMAAATLYTLYKSLRGKGENPIGVAQIDAHAGLSRHRIRGRRCCLRFRGVVHGIRAQARLRPVRRLPIIVGALVLVLRRGCRMKLFPSQKISS